MVETKARLNFMAKRRKVSYHISRTLSFTNLKLGKVDIRYLQKRVSDEFSDRGKVAYKRDWRNDSGKEFGEHLGLLC